MSLKLKSEIRRDYIQEKYVIIAPLRGKRRVDFKQSEGFRPVSKKQCVFCPQSINQQKAILTIGAEDNWEIKVVANKFPAVSLDNPKAYGVQEVVVETADHLAELEDLPKEQVAKILEIYAWRTKAISENKKIEYILIFKNSGGKAGASIWHAHSQIFATQFLPPHLKDKSQRVQAYKLEQGRCVYCDVIKKERKGPRRVWEDGRIIAFCPYAPMHNYEIWIMPKRHLDNITQLNDLERKSFAEILKKVLLKIDQLNLPYNYYFHQVINDKDQHLYMKVTPRGSVWAGVEIGSGLIINPVPPEEAARFYRS